MSHIQADYLACTQAIYDFQIGGIPKPGLEAIQEQGVHRDQWVAIPPSWSFDTEWLLLDWVEVIEDKADGPQKEGEGGTEEAGQADPNASVSKPDLSFISEDGVFSGGSGGFDLFTSAEASPASQRRAGRAGSPVAGTSGGPTNADGPHHPSIFENERDALLQATGSWGRMLFSHSAYAGKKFAHKTKVGDRKHEPVIIRNPAIIYVYKGEFFAITNPDFEQRAIRRKRIPTPGDLVRVIRQNVSKLPAKAIKDFITVNWDRTKGEDDDAKVRAVLARMWTVIVGAVCVNFDAEFEPVPEPTDQQGIPYDDIANQLFSGGTQSKVFTLAAARFLSWRRSGHATGGYPAKGVALQSIKVAGWNTKNDPRCEKATQLFHANLHQSNVRILGALAFKTHWDYWGEFIPKYGIGKFFECEESFAIRGNVETGVAGTAIIVDSVEEFRMLVSARLAHCLQGIEQIDNLLAAYEHVRTYGLLCGKSAGWWTDQNPFGLIAYHVHQKDGTMLTLEADLACAAVHHAISNTLARAEALRTLEANNCTDARRAEWKKIKKMRPDSSIKSMLALSLLLNLSGTQATAGLFQGISTAEAQTAIGIANANYASWARRFHLRFTPYSAAIDAETIDQIVGATNRMLEDRRGAAAQE